MGLSPVFPDRPREFRTNLQYYSRTVQLLSELNQALVVTNIYRQKRLKLRTIIVYRDNCARIILCIVFFFFFCNRRVVSAGYLLYSNRSLTPGIAPLASTHKFTDFHVRPGCGCFGSKYCRPNAVREPSLTRTYFGNRGILARQTAWRARQRTSRCIPGVANKSIVTFF